MSARTELNAYLSQLEKRLRLATVLRGAASLRLGSGRHHSSRRYRQRLCFFRMELSAAVPLLLLSRAGAAPFGLAYSTLAP